MRMARRVQSQTKTITRSANKRTVAYITPKRGKTLLDRQARRYFQMSGKEFVRQYRAGTIPEPDRSEVIRVSMLIPFTES